jgi:putative oxidoreductase
MASLGILILRLITGSLYVLHGLPKLIGGQGSSQKVPEAARQRLGEGFSASMEHGWTSNLSGFLGTIGVPNPRLMAVVVALTELLGGIALIFGWKTRLASLGLSAVQVVAISKVHAKDGVTGSELNVSLFAATTTLALTGPGKIAVD